MMRRWGFVLVGALLGFGISSPILAGQVVTDTARQWAKDALAQEQSITPAPDTVAVLYFRNRTANPQLDPLQKGLAFLLMTDLSTVEGVRLVERIKLQALVEELKLGASGLVDKDSAPRVGKLLGAGYLVGGDLQGGQQAELGIRSDLLQVNTSSSLGSPSAEGQLAQVFDLEKQILFGIIDLLKIALTPAQKQRLQRPATTDYQAFLALCKGLDASDRGNYSGAAANYERALRLDPRFQPAQNALNELRGLGLASLKPRSHAMLEVLVKDNSSTSSLEPTPAIYRPIRPAPTGGVRVTW